MENILPFEKSDLSHLEDLQPEGWNIPLKIAFEFYLSSSLCFPIKYTINQKLIGVGASIRYYSTAWLGHIIVHKAFWKQGIGRKITQHLIEDIDSGIYSTISLIATPMGKGLYEQFGFETDSSYSFFRGGNFEPSLNLPQSYQSQYKDQLLAMDKFASAENRGQLLESHLEMCRIFVENDELKGFYLPKLGEGYICALTKEAGQALLAERAMDFAVIPDDHLEGIDLFLQNGYTLFRTATRMFKGKRLNWNHKHVYSRIGGNLG
jgi:hypothetical protein